MFKSPIHVSLSLPIRYFDTFQIGKKRRHDRLCRCCWEWFDWEKYIYISFVHIPLIHEIQNSGSRLKLANKWLRIFELLARLSHRLRLTLMLQGIFHNKIQSWEISVIVRRNGAKKTLFVFSCYVNTHTTRSSEYTKDSEFRFGDFNSRHICSEEFSHFSFPPSILLRKTMNTTPTTAKWKTLFAVWLIAFLLSPSAKMRIDVKI